MNAFGQFFVNYGEYHHNKVNMIIHVICIPQIIMSLMGLLHPINYLIPIIGWDLLLVGSTTYLYVITEKTVGILTAVWLWASLVFVRTMYIYAKNEHSEGTLFKYFLCQHIFAWVLQFIGHGLFERRSPALVDNLLLVLNAPFFVTAELLKLIGWKKEEFVAIDKEIKQRVLNFHGSSKSSMK